MDRTKRLTLLRIRAQGKKGRGQEREGGKMIMQGNFVISVELQ